MHHYESKDGKTSFNYNSDFSGSVFIEDHKGASMEVSGKALLEFVAYCYIAPGRISEIEDMDYKELLE
jgi:hypothetical protein